VTGNSLKDSQLAMARYLRDPVAESPPQGVEQRRMAIYQRLVYNNIESFISSGFPVLRSLYDDGDWHALVRSFIVGHRCHTPYFLEISQEFIQFLMTEYQPREQDPPFLAELAHYEWVELALDVAEAQPPDPAQPGDVLSAVPQLSPLAWLLCYHYPVQHIGPGFRPAQPGEPTYLVVYRDRQERVQFMALNAFTARLVELTRDNSSASGRDLLETLATESGMALADLLEAGAGQLQELYQASVLGTPADAGARH
jgi:hypothetical protein